MDSERINSLLEKYWNCETSLDEEKELRGYFSQGEFPESLKDTSLLFRYFTENKKNALNDISFDREIMNRLRPTRPGKVRNIVFNGMRIAAGVAVLVVATWFVRNEIRSRNPAEAADTYDDPKIAFEETKKALMMISKSFGAAEQEARKINMFNEAQEQVRKEKETTEATL